MNAYSALLLLSVALSAAGADSAFDVASVKYLGDSGSLPAGFSTLPQRSGGHIRWVTNQALLVRYAFHMQDWRIQKLEPNFSDCAIDATTRESATEDEIRVMFQKFLADRFKMAVHRETKEVNGYALVTAKGGPKFPLAKPGDAPAPMPEYLKGRAAAPFEGRVFLSVEGGQRAVIGRRVSIARLAETLQEPLRAFVNDETGLRGEYYFSLLFVPEDNPKGVDGPSIFAAVQEQLGLKLEKRKGPIEVLVVDHMETVPIGN